MTRFKTAMPIAAILTLMAMGATAQPLPPDMSVVIWEAFKDAGCSVSIVEEETFAGHVSAVTDVPVEVLLDPTKEWHGAVEFTIGMMIMAGLVQVDEQAGIATMPSCT